jgi:hypothetical protein
VAAGHGRRTQDRERPGQNWAQKNPKFKAKGQKRATQKKKKAPKKKKQKKKQKQKKSVHTKDICSLENLC